MIPFKEEITIKHNIGGLADEFFSNFKDNKSTLQDLIKNVIPNVRDPIYPIKGYKESYFCNDCKKPYTGPILGNVCPICKSETSSVAMTTEVLKQTLVDLRARIKAVRNATAETSNRVAQELQAVSSLAEHSDDTLLLAA